jgi:hypothetical protein
MQGKVTGPARLASGRYWFRTSDLCRVKAIKVHAMTFLRGARLMHDTLLTANKGKRHGDHQLGCR